MIEQKSAEDRGNTKRFAVFLGEAYDKFGGWDDFKGAFESEEAATSFLVASPLFDPIYDWAHIVNLDTFDVVARFEPNMKDRFYASLGLEKPHETQP